MIPPPARGTSGPELEARTERAQTLMRDAGLDVMVLTAEPEIRYFTGFQSQFWESPTRPWYLVLGGTGKPIAVIPGIGKAGMAATWIEDVRTWPAPRPDDDGISLLVDTVASLVPQGRLGMPLGHESSLRMPAADFLRLRAALPRFEVVDAVPVLRRVRAIKSDTEIAKIRYVCDLVSEAFEALPGHIRPGMSEREICKHLQRHVLELGADATPYLIAGSGPGGYDNIIMGPTDRRVGAGDVLIIDTGSTFDGYFCDFDRNFAFGEADDAARRAYEAAFRATDAGFAAARPGATTSDVWAAMWPVLEAAGALGNEVGRMGHGLGMQLTEWPSNMPGDDTVLQPGMVLTLEPGMLFAEGRMMVHEEDIVIREGGPELLTRRAPAELPVIR